MGSIPVSGTLKSRTNRHDSTTDEVVPRLSISNREEARLACYKPLKPFRKTKTTAARRQTETETSNKRLSKANKRTEKRRRRRHFDRILRNKSFRSDIDQLRKLKNDGAIIFFLIYLKIYY